MVSAQCGSGPTHFPPHFFCCPRSLDLDALPPQQTELRTRFRASLTRRDQQSRRPQLSIAYISCTPARRFVSPPPLAPTVLAHYHAHQAPSNPHQLQPPTNRTPHTSPPRCRKTVPPTCSRSLRTVLRASTSISRSRTTTMRSFSRSSAPRRSANS
jgi:hypothetical protein